MKFYRCSVSPVQRFPRHLFQHTFQSFNTRFKTRRTRKFYAADRRLRKLQRLRLCIQPHRHRGTIGNVALQQPLRQRVLQ